MVYHQSENSRNTLENCLYDESRKLEVHTRGAEPGDATSKNNAMRIKVKVVCWKKS